MRSAIRPGVCRSQRQALLSTAAALYRVRNYRHENRLEHGQKEVLDLLDEVVSRRFLSLVSDSPGTVFVRARLIRGADLRRDGIWPRACKIHGQIARALEKKYTAPISIHIAPKSRITTASRRLGEGS